MGSRAIGLVVELLERRANRTGDIYDAGELLHVVGSARGLYVLGPLDCRPIEDNRQDLRAVPREAFRILGPRKPEESPFVEAS